MNWIALLAALAGAMAVGAGAFGAHSASGQAVEWLKTGGHYQLIHAVAALVALRMEAKGPALLFVIGGGFFAGSLYLMAVFGPSKILGPITPLGGALLIAGWLWLAWAAAKG
ncbi:MAG: DUF423 domain-containing protein [Pseudomonadota bacterium]